MSIERDTIWVHRFVGTRARVVGLSPNSPDGFMGSFDVLYEHSVNKIQKMDELNFKCLYDYVGKAKHKIVELDKLLLEVENE